MRKTITPGYGAHKTEKEGAVHVDTKWLAKSHFRIAQDNNSAMSKQSVFKTDYVPKIFGKTETTRPPSPAWIHTKDERYFNDTCTETKNAYDDKNTTNLERPNYDKYLRQVNVKFEADPKVFNSFITTQKRDFVPYILQANKKAGPKTVPGESNIPSGDRSKALPPVSDYRDQFRQHDLNSDLRADKGKDAYANGDKPTILGDVRQHEFLPSHRHDYKACYNTPAQPLPPAKENNIMMGDPSKVNTALSEMHHAFPYYSNVTNDKDALATKGKNQITSFKLGDERSNNFKYSTMKGSYIPMDNNWQGIPKYERNKSSFPVDDNPTRMTLRANTTSNNMDYTEKTNSPARIVSGADKRTASNVVFGEPPLYGQFFETTQKNAFQPNKNVHTKIANKGNHGDAVPMDYWKDFKAITTVQNDYGPIDTTHKITPNPEAIAALRGTNIDQPYGGERQFNTENKDQFYAKDMPKKDRLNVWKFQKSSVPLGSL